jgi:hypothetical protein
MQLTEEEWCFTEALVNLLAILREGTKLVEGEKRPTISVTVPMIYYLLVSLEEQEGFLFPFL